MVKDIGTRIAEVRKARGLNQDELAELSTLSRITVARYETGRVEPGAMALGKIASYPECHRFESYLSHSETPGKSRPGAFSLP